MQALEADSDADGIFQITGVPTKSVSQVVEDFVRDGAVMVTTKLVSDGKWTVSIKLK